MIFDVATTSIFFGSRGRAHSILHARDLLLSLPVALKKGEGGLSRENLRTICDLLRNVTRHRRRHCRPPPRPPHHRRFISRVSFRRYCHSRPIKNARSHARGVHIVLIKRRAVEVIVEGRVQIGLRALFPGDVLFDFSMNLRLTAWFRGFSNGQREAVT